MLIPTRLFGQLNEVNANSTRLLNSIGPDSDLHNLFAQLDLMESNGREIVLEKPRAAHGEKFYVFSLLENAVGKKFYSLIESLFQELSLWPWGTLCLMAGTGGLTQFVYLANMFAPNDGPDKSRMRMLIESADRFRNELFDPANRFEQHHDLWTAFTNLHKALIALGAEEILVNSSRAPKGRFTGLIES